MSSYLNIIGLKARNAFLKKLNEKTKNKVLLNFVKLLKKNKKNLIKENIKIKDDTTFPIDKLAKKNFVELLKKKNITKIPFPKKDYSFEDLPIDFVKKCNKLVCALLIKISKNNLNYDFELIKPEFYLIDLCSDFTQYKSLVKSVKVNFDILNEVPEENLLSMKDVYYYIYNHLI